MNTNQLKTFAREARTKLLDLVGKKLEYVLTADTAELRGKANLIGELKKQIQSHGKEQVIEKVAYTWFNRLMALRFMDANGYTNPKVVTPTTGNTIPEILQEAKAGHFDDSLKLDRQRLNDLIDGRTSMSDAQTEAYKLLLIASCNSWYTVMPFMFERINDYTELLLPDDLLSDFSIVADMRDGMSDEDCKQVEIIGWMYQFYISEKKDEVFEALAGNKKITPENIPAATQLFTPNWIVRYLVENSLGRLWMLNRPHSKLMAQMQYYIKPEEAEQDFLKISSPEEIKLCDPACGSGHMLVYAFALLCLIYEEEGYPPTEIPAKILTNNLYGVEIDERAGELAAFALTMIAREKYHRFFKKPVQPNICVLQKIDFTAAKDPKSAKGDLFTNVKWEDRGWENILDELCKSGVRREDLLHDLNLFAEADNVGSLVKPNCSPAQLNASTVVARTLHEQYMGDAFLNVLTEGVLTALRQAEYLSKRYQIVVANPPYMGSKGINERLKAFLQEQFPNVKSDVFAAFVVRNTELAVKQGQLGFMTPFVWMFISSYEELRKFLIDTRTITSLIQLEYSGFDGATVPICTFTIENSHDPMFNGGYIRLSDFRGPELQAPKTLEAIGNPKCGWFYRTSAANFKKISGSPIAYWVSRAVADSFSQTDKTIGHLVESEGKNVTTDNARFTRYWWEVQYVDLGRSPKRWFPFAAGGPYRKWYGNHADVIDWSDAALKYYRGSPAGRLIREEFWYLQGVTWSKITSNKASFRLLLRDQTYQEVAILFREQSESNLPELLGLLNSKVSEIALRALAPTLNFQLDDVCRIPWRSPASVDANSIVSTLIQDTKLDWDSYETSWDFTFLPHLQTEFYQRTLKLTYFHLYAHWHEMTIKVKGLEENNNRIVIEAYGLQDELKSEVPLNEITLTCNPHYRYGGDKSREELEALLLSDTMKEYVSYAIGCMLGRYSIDKPGLVLANQGEAVKDYLKLVPEPTFLPDEDNIIPVLEGEYFTDDIVGRFKEFLEVTFGREHYNENLEFIEDAIGKDIRKYFVKDFYNDHVKRYKKRPIYWMFSSPKRTFNALIYMHRYRPDTVSQILNDYLRAFIGKLEANRQSLTKTKLSESASARERTQADKNITDIESMLKELKSYERTMFEVAAKKIEIDLDDGVKVNYLKFKDVLYPIKGLDKDEE